MQLDENFLKNSSQKFRVKEVCAFLNTTPRILKYYEECGVLRPARSKENEYREYAAEDVIKIQTAERLKRTALTQQEISDYFSGDLDLAAKRESLLALKNRIDRLINDIDLELADGRFDITIEEQKSMLCFCKSYRSNGNPLDRYTVSRQTYVLAIKSGCVCDIENMFFILHENMFPLPKNLHTDENELLPESVVEREKASIICVPVISAPQSVPQDCQAKRIEFKRALTLRTSCALKSATFAYKVLQDEAEKRNLTLSGRAWVISETGPHKKTARHTYTFTLSAELSD